MAFLLLDKKAIKLDQKVYIPLISMTILDECIVSVKLYHCQTCKSIKSKSTACSAPEARKIN